MSKFSYEQQILEQEYFNWYCVICSEIAKSPQHLEDQWFDVYQPLIDLDGKHWVKCFKCFSPFHVNCLVSKPPEGEYIWVFLVAKIGIEKVHLDDLDLYVIMFAVLATSVFL